MSEKGYTLETRRRVYDDGTGECIEIAPNPDGGDALEIRLVDDTGKISTHGRILIPRAAAALVAKALIAAAQDQEEHSER